MSDMHPVEAFILRQTPEHRQMLLVMRDMILSASPDIIEKFSFKVPFYHAKGMLCYLSVLKKEEAIEWCFCYGASLDDPGGLLRAKNRKLIWGVTIQSLQDLEEKAEALDAILHSAIAVNANRKKKGLKWNQ